MFLGLQWYWWLVLIVLFVVALPLKIKLTKRLLNKSTKESKHKDD